MGNFTRQGHSHYLRKNLANRLWRVMMKQGLVEDALPALPIETQGIYAVYPPGRFTQPKVRAFIDFLVHAFADRDPQDW